MRWHYLISLVALLSSGLLLFFNILCGSTTATPINKWYWLEAGTESIPGANPVTRWTNYNSCGVSNGRNVDCTGSSAAYPMSPASNFDTTEGVPEGLQSRRGTTYYLSKTGWAFLLIGLLFTLLALIPNLFSICLPSMRWLTGTTGMFTVLALLFIALSASLLTAGYVKTRNSFRDAGHSTSLGRTMLAFIWTSVFLLVVATAVNSFGFFTTSKMADSEKQYTDNYDITSSNNTYGNDYSGGKSKKKTFGFLKRGNTGQEVVDDAAYTGGEPIDQLENSRTVTSNAPPYGSGQLRGTEHSASTNLATGAAVAGVTATGLAHHQQGQTRVNEGQHSRTVPSTTAKAPPGDLYKSDATRAQKLVDSAMDTSTVIGSTTGGAIGGTQGIGSIQHGDHNTSARSQQGNLDEPSDLEEFKRSQAREATDTFEATAVTGTAGTAGLSDRGRGTAYHTSYSTADISKDKNTTYVGTGENLEDWRKSENTSGPNPSTSGQYEKTGVYGEQGVSQHKASGLQHTLGSSSSPDQSKVNDLKDEANRASLQRAHDLGVNAGAYAAGKKAGLQHVKQQHEEASLGDLDGNSRGQEVGIAAGATGATVTQGKDTQSSQTPSYSHHSKGANNKYLDEVYKQRYKEGAYAAGVSAGKETKKDKLSSSSDASQSISGSYSQGKTDEKLEQVYEKHYKAGAYVAGLKSGHQESLNVGDEGHIPVENSYAEPGKGASGGTYGTAGSGAFLATDKESDQRKGRTSDDEAYQTSEQISDHAESNKSSGGKLAYHGGDVPHITAGQSDVTFTDAFGSKKRDVSGDVGGDVSSSENKASGRGILATAAGMLGLGAAATSGSTEGEDQEVTYTGKPDTGPGATLSGANAEQVEKAKACDSSHYENKSTTLPIQQQGSRQIVHTGVPDNSAKSAAQAASASSMGHFVEPSEGPASRVKDTYNSAHIGSKGRENDFTTTSGYVATEYYERKTGGGVDSSCGDAEAWNSGDRSTETGAFSSATGGDASSHTADVASWKDVKDTTKTAGDVDESDTTSKQSTAATKESGYGDLGTVRMATIKGKSSGGGSESTTSSSGYSGKGHGKSKSTDYDRVGEQSGVDKSYRTASETAEIKPVVDLNRNRNPIAEGIASANLDEPADIHASHAMYESNTADKLKSGDVTASNTPGAPVGLRSQPTREEDSYSSSSRGRDSMSKSQALGDSASSTYGSEGGDLTDVTSNERYTTDTKTGATRSTLDPKFEPQALEEANREAAEAQNETSFVKQIINTAKNVI